MLALLLSVTSLSAFADVECPAMYKNYPLGTFHSYDPIGFNKGSGYCNYENVKNGRNTICALIFDRVEMIRTLTIAPTAPFRNATFLPIQILLGTLLLTSPSPLFIR